MRKILSLLATLTLAIPAIGQEIQSAPEYRFGWLPDPDGAHAFAESLSPELAEAKARLVREDDGRDVLLYRHVVECLRDNPELARRWLRDNRLRSYNQGRVGSCTGHGTAAALNCVLAVQCVLDGDTGWFTPLAADALYGLGREQGGMLRSGDGCCGFMLADAISKRGTLFRIRYEQDNRLICDLTEYDENRCREFGRRGVGDELKEQADDHIVVTVAPVQDASEAWSLIGSGYAINVCSNQGFRTQRDSEGICEPQGSWAHSMAVIGRRTASDGRKLFLIQNSWGDENPSGPFWKDQPWGSFFIAYEVADRMLKQGDSFAYSEIGGFDPRKIRDLGTREFIGDGR